MIKYLKILNIAFVCLLLSVPSKAAIINDETLEIYDPSLEVNAEVIELNEEIKELNSVVAYKDEEINQLQVQIENIEKEKQQEIEKKKEIEDFARIIDQEPFDKIGYQNSNYEKALYAIEFLNLEKAKELLNAFIEEAKTTDEDEDLQEEKEKQVVKANQLIGEIWFLEGNYEIASEYFNTSYQDSKNATIILLSLYKIIQSLEKSESIEEDKRAQLICETISVYESSLQQIKDTYVNYNALLVDIEYITNTRHNYCVEISSSEVIEGQ